MMNISGFVNANISSLIRDLSALIEIPSVLDKLNYTSDAPFGVENVKCLNAFLDLAKKDGFKVKNVDNVAGYVELESAKPGAKTLGILCHLDVVPAPADGWNTPPFKATIVGNKIYGRGTADDKGPLMAAYYALKAIKEEGIKLEKNVRIIVGTDEESGSRCLHRYLEVEGEPDVAFSPDADFPVIYGEKGIASFDFLYRKHDEKLISFESGDVYNVVPDRAVLKTTLNLDKEYEKFLFDSSLKGEIQHSGKVNSYILYGKRAHAMNPVAGVNALVNLASFAYNYFDDNLIKFVSKKLSDPFAKGLGAESFDQEMKHLTMNVANIRSENGEEKVGINIRYPSVESYEKFVNFAKDEAASFGVALKQLGNSTPHFVSKESKLVRDLMESYREVSGDTVSEPITIGGGTYARDLKNAVAFGMLLPGEEDVMHQANEYVKISVLEMGVKIYYKVIIRLAQDEA